MAYADFHVHGNFKTFYSAYDVDKKASPWDSVKIRFEKLMFKRKNRVLRSQSCFTQLKKGGLELGVMPLYSTERGFVQSFLMRVLDFTSYKIDNRLFSAIGKNKKTYWEQLGECYKHLERAFTDDFDGHEKINFTRCSQDFLPGHMNIVLSMEGAHCFLDKSDDVNKPECLDMIVSRMLLYKKRIPVNGYPRVFIMNHTHLTRAPFSNHAFGIKMIEHRDFVPQGSGISSAGLKIIETALSYDADHYPMIIDIKHLSVASRKQYYALRRSKYGNIPIIASHAACTGISFDQINDYIEEINSAIANQRQCNLVSWRKPKGILPNTEFNPWSINLYDEDIVEILLSDGIIGLSLDQRILGCGKVAREKMSKDETFSGVMYSKPVLANDPGEGPETEGEEIHFRHFCNNLFHIVRVGNRISGTEIDPWEKIVIGSDFDGLIDPVDFCIDATEYYKIEQWLKLKLPSLAIEANIDLPANLDKAIQGILFENGFNFLNKYYSASYY